MQRTPKGGKTPASGSQFALLFVLIGICRRFFSESPLVEIQRNEATRVIET